MKTAKNLYPRLSSPENLREAFNKAARGRSADAVVIAFRKNFDANIEALREQFLSRRFTLGRYHFFTIRDPKVRTICAAAFPERVLHHAIMNVCEPVFEAYHIADSYACRKNKGNARAVERAQQFSKRHAWYLKLDIAKYFDNIDHGIALELLARRFKDTALLSLFATILNSYHTAPGKGLPIGNLFSQHLANLYLGVLDHWLKEERRVKAYLRYMDDFLLFADDPASLRKELDAITRYLCDTLCLRLKYNIQLNRVALGVPFLGYRVFPACVRLNARSKYRFSEKYRNYERLYCEGRWSEKELSVHMESLCAFTQQSDSLAFRRFCIERFGVLS
jgi:retron-type reverse transcriptase